MKILLTMLALLAGMPESSDYQHFSSVGDWEIVKDEDGCAAALTAKDKVLLIYPDTAKPLIAFFHPSLKVRSGSYPIALRIGPPFSFDGTATGTVMNASDQMIFFPIQDKQSLERIMGSKFIGFTLREREQFFSLTHGADAWRMLEICRQNAEDPFQVR